MTARALSALALALSIAGCRDSPLPPSQKAVDEAWKRADDAMHQMLKARSDVKHVARLRDIDRLRYQSETSDLQSQVAVLRGLGTALGLALLAAIVWLAAEVRRRRVLSAAVLEIAGEKRKTTRDRADAQRRARESDAESHAGRRDLRRGAYP